MQRFAALVLLFHLGIMVLVGCGGTPSQSAQAQPLSLLVTTTGTVKLKREGWTDYQPAPIGTRLYPTDLLDVEDTAIIVCDIAGVPTVQIAKAIGKTPCSTQGSTLEYDGARFRSGQRSPPKDIPYILFPRRTLIVNTNPTLMWHDTKANSYDVSIVEGSKVIWEQTNISGTSILYPKNAPVLQPGITYQVVVRDNLGKTSDDEPAKDLGFRVLNTAKRTEIEQHQQAIQKLTGIDPVTQKLVLAAYYATLPEEDGRSLFGEALLLFEDIKQTQNTPAIQLWMGDMFNAMSLSDEAASAYQSALQQATSSGDRASQAAAEAGLWRVTHDKAHYDAAVNFYQELGDQQELTNLRNQANP